MSPNFQAIPDADLLTLSALMTALLTLAQRDGLALPTDTSLREFTQTCVAALTERGLLAESTHARVIVIAGDQITEWSDGYPFTKDNRGDLPS